MAESLLLNAYIGIGKRSSFDGKILASEDLLHMPSLRLQPRRGVDQENMPTTDPALKTRFDAEQGANGRRKLFLYSLKIGRRRNRGGNFSLRTERFFVDLAHEYSIAFKERRTSLQGF